MLGRSWGRQKSRITFLRDPPRYQSRKWMAHQSSGIIINTLQVLLLPDSFSTDVELSGGRRIDGENERIIVARQFITLEGGNIGGGGSQRKYFPIQPHKTFPQLSPPPNEQLLLLNLCVHFLLLLFFCSSHNHLLFLSFAAFSPFKPFRWTRLFFPLSHFSSQTEKIVEEK